MSHQNHATTPEKETEGTFSMTSTSSEAEPPLQQNIVFQHNIGSKFYSDTQLFSAFISLAGSLEGEESVDDAYFETVSQYRHKDIGVLNRYQQTIGYGSDFYVTCNYVEHESNLATIVFKRTIPTVTREDATRTRKRIEALMRELRVLTHPPIKEHENIVDFLGIAWETDPFDIAQKWPVILMEHASHGSLADYFQLDYANVTFQHKVSMALDIVLGLKAMHLCGILHGDVKAENMLVFSNHNAESKAHRPTLVKLADFGGVVFDPSKEVKIPSGTRPWDAPEAHMALSPASLLATDVYSLGFLIYRILVDGKHPFRDSPTWNDDARWSRAEAMKSNGDKMLEYLCSITTCQQEQHTGVVHQIYGKTIRKNPSLRDVDAVRVGLERLSSSPIQRTIPAALDLLPSQLQLKDQTIPFSFKGHQTLDHNIATYVTGKLQTAVLEAGESTNISSEACYALAVLAINDSADSIDQHESIRRGLKWLKSAALAGNDRAQAVYCRVATVAEQPVLSEEIDLVMTWLQDTASRGFFAAHEELFQMGHHNALEHARKKLSTRYGGVGASRFLESMFVLDGVSIEDKSAFDEKFTLICGGIRTLPKDLPLSQAGDSVLHFVSCCGLTRSLEVLLKNIDATKVDARNVRDETALLLACRSGNYQEAMMLYEAGASPSLADMYGDTPLHWLLSFSDEHAAELVEKFLHRGAQINAIAQRRSYIHCGENTYQEGTPLMRAISRNRLGIVEILLRFDADPDIVVCNTDSAIMYAVGLHYHDILSRLLDKTKNTPKTVNPMSGISYLPSALMQGCSDGPGTVFGRIRRHGRHWKHRAQQTVQVLLDHGANDHFHDIPGFPDMTIIFIAAQAMAPDMLAYLLDHGGSDFVNTPSSDADDVYRSQGIMRYPISGAISSRSLESLRLLIKYGADVNNRERIPTIDEPVTMLYICAWMAVDDPEFAKLLIENGTGVNVDDGPADYETPFACAVRNRCFKLASFLWSKGANPNVEFSAGLWFTQTLSMTLLGYLVDECSISTLAPLSFLIDLVSEASSPSCLSTNDFAEKPFDAAGTDTTASKSQQLSFKVNARSGKTVLHAMACVDFAHQDSRAERLIFEKVVEFFAPDISMLDARDTTSNWTALQTAMMYGNARLVESLLAEGCSVDQVDDDGDTPLYFAHACQQFWPDSSPSPDKSSAVLSARQRTRLKSNREQIVRTVERYTDPIAVVDDDDDDGDVGVNDVSKDQ